MLARHQKLPMALLAALLRCARAPQKEGPPALARGAGRHRGSAAMVLDVAPGPGGAQPLGDGKFFVGDRQMQRSLARCSLHAQVGVGVGVEEQIDQRHRAAHGRLGEGRGAVLEVGVDRLARAQHGTHRL